MDTKSKIVLSILGSLIVGASQYYSAHSGDVMDIRFWLGLLFASLAPVGTYLMGFYQLNPGNQPKTKEQFLDAIKQAGDEKLREDLREALK